MLAKRYRLPIQSFVKKAGQTRKSRHFLLKLFSSEGAHFRVGVIISRKVAAKATKRNQLKRTIFNFFRKNFQSLQIKDYLVIVLPGTANLKKEQIEEELNKIL